MRSQKRRSLDKLGFWKMVSIGFVFLAVNAISSPAQTLNTISTFTIDSGANPYGTLVQGVDGNFYGTTVGGGAYRQGAVFKVTPQGALTTLYSFCAQPGCPDGAEPYGGLVQGSDGNFYGTTALVNNNCASGCGTIFKITPDGALTTLYNFCTQTNCPDGGQPSSSLIEGSDGNFYGTTAQGGANRYGTVFKITSDGMLTTLYNFCAQTNCADGQLPHAGLVQASDGNFYGTTYGGGTKGSGTVFKITAAGTLTTLYSFCSQFNCTDGASPYATLVQGSDGNLYGTTLSGASTCISECGTIFRITTSGNLTTLHNFNGTDGRFPVAGLAQGADGNFYGTTVEGGLNDAGTVFKVTPAGALSTLYSFCVQTNCTDGALPYAGLVQGTDGTFYGTTWAQTVFSLLPSASGPATLTTLTSSTTPTFTGQPVTFTAAVNNANGTPSSGSPPSGTVTFTISGNKPVAVPLSNGQAEFPWTFIYAGPRTVTASYSGDATNLPSGSVPIGELVNAPASTTTRLISSLNPSMANGAVTFTAIVTASNGSMPTGSVTFAINGDNAASVPLNNGQAMFNWTFLNDGPRTVTASYSGDAGDLTSTSPGLTQQVGLPRTQTTLTSSLEPSSVHQLVMYVATVTGQVGVPSGTVTFTINGNRSVGEFLVNGRAIFPWTFLHAGPRTVTAVYSGDSNNQPSSSTMRQMVNP